MKRQKKRQANRQIASRALPLSKTSGGPKAQEVDNVRRFLPASWHHGWLYCIFLFIATLIAYLPVWHAGFAWDDDRYVTNNFTLRSLEGLRQIWFEPGVTSQYYPLTFTVFWLEYHLWGLNPLGYHLVNVLLHSLNAILLWQILRRLHVPEAWLAGAIFALHPVNVMSVAWISELKNTLATALALGAGYAYLRFSVFDRDESAKNLGNDQQLRWRYYILSLVLFLLAMCAKTAVSFLPVTLLLVLWWKRGRINRRDVLTVIPMIGIVIAMGLTTISMEHHSEAITGGKFNVNFLGRVLISGRSFWFYLGKLFFPYQLTFIYERWKINTESAWQYAYPAATLALLVALWATRRRIGRGLWVAAMHFYICTSMLVLIMILYMMRYTFVSDHWQYFGCMSIIAVAAAGITQLLNAEKVARIWSMSIIAGLLLGLGTLTWRQCGMYANLETLWLTTLARNPEAFIAHDDLGIILVHEGRLDEAIAHFKMALKIQPDDVMAQDNLGNALLQKGDVDDAIICFQRTLEIQPDHAMALSGLGEALLEKGRIDEAIGKFQEALKLTPNLDIAHRNLDLALKLKEQTMTQTNRVLWQNIDH